MYCRCAIADLHLHQICIRSALRRSSKCCLKSHLQRHLRGYIISNFKYRGRDTFFLQENMHLRAAFNSLHCRFRIVRLLLFSFLWSWCPTWMDRKRKEADDYLSFRLSNVEGEFWYTSLIFFIITNAVQWIQTSFIDFFNLSVFYLIWFFK